jgi:cell division septation protein DedD
MKKNDTGEFELVVGDRQLLSAFFIVVLLCAVAFAMGYVVGQSGPKSGKIMAEAPAVSPSTSAADARPQALPPAPAAVTPPAATGETPPADSSPQPTTQPAVNSPGQQAAQKTAQEPAKPSEPAATALVAPEDLPAGNFWQVLAVPQPQAELMRTTLKDNGFGVILSPGPRSLTRVLVGPYADITAMGQAKTLLEKAGMHPVRYKP